MSTHPTDVLLIRRIQARETEAFEALFTRYRQMITAHVARIVRDDVVAQDLVQEVFLRVWTRAEQWDGRGKVKGWIYRIATNLSLNHLRSAKRRPQQGFEMPVNEMDDDDGSSAPSWMIDTSALTPEALLEGTEQQRILWQLIEELPTEKREVFKMVYDEEMDLHSVASVLGIPEGTVKSRLYYSRKQLRQGLTKKHKHK
jgi:RNA polymerase sigma-70 factor (ECF subfamily)